MARARARANAKAAKRERRLRAARRPMPLWFAVLAVVLFPVVACAALFIASVSHAEGAALAHGPCGAGVPRPCLTIELGILGEPYETGGRNPASHWPVELVGRHVEVPLSASAAPPAEAGDRVAVGLHDDDPVTLVVDGVRYDVNRTGWAGVALALGGCAVFAVLAATASARLVDWPGRLRRRVPRVARSLLPVGIFTATTGIGTMAGGMLDLDPRPLAVAVGTSAVVGIWCTWWLIRRQARLDAET